MIKKLSQIQAELKAPKNQRNTFGNYNYRNCEDILEAVKPLLKEFDISLTITDEIVLVGDRFYVKATAKISDGTNEISTTAFAREAETKKGMDEAQITGSASSYARKYALNGLFCIDDTKDADSTNKHGKDEIKQDIPKDTECFNEQQIKNFKTVVSKFPAIESQIKKEFEVTSCKQFLKADFSKIMNRVIEIKKEVA